MKALCPPLGPVRERPPVLKILLVILALIVGSPSLAATTPDVTVPAPAKAIAPPAMGGAITPPAALPAPPPAPATPAPDPLLTAPQTLVQFDNEIPTTTDDDRLAAIGVQASAIEARADAAMAGLAPQLASVQHDLAKITPARGRRPTAEERQARAPLLARKAMLQAELGRMQALAGAAGDTFSRVAQRRREGFSARVFERSPSPLTPDFWTALVDASSSDLARLRGMAWRSWTAAVTAAEPRGLAGALVGLLLAGVILIPLRRWLRRIGRTLGGRAVALGGFTRAAVAVWVAAIDTGAPALAADMARYGLGWGGLLSPIADTLAGALVGAITWSAAILALGRAFATMLDPDQRLDAKDPNAARTRVALWAVAVVTSAGFVLRQVNYAIGASVAATIASNCILSLAYAAVAALILVTFGRRRRVKAQPVAEAARSPVWTMVSLALTLAIVVTVAAVLSGYTTLASLISGQIFWLSLIGAATFLLLRFIDEGLGAIFQAGGRTTRAVSTLFGLQASTVLQASLLVSAMLQILVLIAALTLALTPFGQSGEQLFSHVGQFGNTLQIGKARISPIAIAQGLAVFAVGMGLVHLVRGWVVRRYLPVTGWDSGLRNSVATGVGYLGVGVTLICAFTAMGLGFQQIALIASALSVGIGFGLQQIVQNFVSGIILLIERPVKVGDWVDLGSGVEGDVRRIRVRATEIQTFDRSTVIVPNSSFITQNVRNKTLGDPRGRIELKLTIAKAADAAKARELMLEATKAHKEVLADPAPSAFIDSTGAAGSVNLKGYAHVDGPRDAYRVRSELYLAIIDRYEQAGIALGGA